MIDEQWLEAEIEKIAATEGQPMPGNRLGARQRTHPLGELVYQVRGELRSWGTPSFRATPQLAKLGALASAIERLRNLSVLGVEQRIPNLMSSDWNLFESTRFELEVADLHTQLGRSVMFIPEVPGHRTPDMLIDETVEVECKRRVHLSQRDLGMREIWRQLQQRLHPLLAVEGRHYRIEMSTRTAPQRPDANWAMTEVKRIVDDGSFTGDMRVIDEERGRDLRVSALVVEAGVHEPYVRVTLPIDARPEEEFDVAHMEQIAELQGGRMNPGYSTIYAFRTDDQKDWVEGVRSSLKSARSQLSGDRPGVVFVEAPAAVQASNRGDIGNVKRALDEAFRNSQRISGVVIAYTGWVEGEPGLGYALSRYNFEANPSARHPIRDDYASGSR
jgi:hypothetical protein